jgi:hypothetical protein
VLYTLGWLFIVALLALWSLAVWAIHGLAVWSVSQAGALAGAASGAAVGAERLRLPEWLAPWLPPEAGSALRALLTDLAPVVDGLLAGAPALSGWLGIAGWFVWGLGSLVLVVLGAGLHAMAVVLRRRGAVVRHPGSGAPAA